LLVVVVTACDSSAPCSNAYGLEAGGRYERHMKVAKAWRLCPTGSDEKEKYRFVWLRGSDNPVIISLVKDRLKAEITAVRLDGTGEKSPGGITEMRNRVLSGEEFDRFRSLIEQADFWNLKPRERLIAEGSGDPGVNGDRSRWIFEGAVENRAHAVDRGADVHGPFREAGLYLLELSLLNLNGEIY
jgi:hypothetical protein